MGEKRKDGTPYEPCLLDLHPWARTHSSNVKMELELRWICTSRRTLSTVLAVRTEVPEGCHLSTWYNCSWSKVRYHPCDLTSKTLVLQEGHLASESPKPHPTSKVLHSLNSTFVRSNLHVTTSWPSWGWAQTRVSPRHSSSSFILGGMTPPQ